MRYLAITRNYPKMAYSVFDDKTLVSVGFIKIKQKQTHSKQLYDLLAKFDKILKDLKPSIMLTHMKYDTRISNDKEYVIEIKTLMQVACENNNVLFMEFDTNGWEYAITQKRVSQKRKIDFVNKGYDLSIDSIDIADAIILGEGVVWNKLYLGK